jgi:hypothetical protein
MLITFKVSNFLSFDEETTFSMLAGKVKEPPTHTIAIGTGRNKINVLKTAILYGANASGKSNLIKAIDFAKQLITKGIKEVDTYNKHFRLDAEAINKPTKFEFEFKVGEKIYAYGVVLSLKNRTFLEEWLFEVGKTSDKPIFERTVLEIGKSKIDIHVKFDPEGEKRFDVYKKDVKNTQLFLYEVNDKDIEDINGSDIFEASFNWFDDYLFIVYPQSKFFALDTLIEDKPFEEEFCKFLIMFNTGIKSIQAIEVSEDELTNIVPKNLLDKIHNDFRDEKMERAGINISGSKIYIQKLDDEILKFKKMVSKHLQIANNDYESQIFEIHEESDGTQRIMDLIPILMMLSNSENTVFIDEIDRSLHPELTHKIVEIFLANSQGVESQLIATTHESSLLDLDLLRRDEIWFVEKDNAGASRLYSLEEFKPRHDKEIRKAYLQGRFGAIPFIADVSNLGWLKEAKNKKQN